jgi:hypothetical protein
VGGRRKTRRKEMINFKDILKYASKIATFVKRRKETINNMRDRITLLEDQLKFKEKLSWNGKTFEYEENGKKIFICNGCHADGKHVYMSERKKSSGYHTAKCPVCNNHVIFSYENSPTRTAEQGINGW